MYLLFSSSLSDLANWIYRITVLTYVVEKYNSAFSSSLVSLMMVMPSVALGYFAGKVADSKNKKLIMACSDTIRILLIGMFLLPEQVSILVVLIISSVAVFADVCEDSILPELASGNDLARINSIYSFISSAIMIVGPSVGGLVAANCSKEQSLIIIAFLLLLALSLRALIRYQAHQDNAKSIATQSSFRDVYRYVASQKTLKGIVSSTGMIAFAAGMMNSLLILFVYQVLGKNSADYGLMLSVKGAAMTVFSLLLVRWSKKMDCKKMYVVSTLGMGLATLLLPINRIWILTIALQSINAIFNIIFSVTRKTLIQKFCDPEKLGRFFGFMSVISNVASVASLLIFGCITDTIGVTSSLLIGGIIILLAGAVVLWNMRSFGLSGFDKPTKELQ